jgi:hypothetical protein
VKSAAFWDMSVRTHAHIPKCGVLPRKFPKSPCILAEKFSKTGDAGLRPRLLFLSFPLFYGSRQAGIESAFGSGFLVLPLSS